MSERTLILLAEDSPTQAELIRHILEQAGYEVESAENGVNALESLRARKPALVISDILMPLMNGYELCRRIRSSSETADLPVILLTSLSDTTDVMEALSCGADSFVTKPANRDYLLSHITHILAGTKRPFKADASTKGVEIIFEGKPLSVATDPRRNITMLISTYEAAVQRNVELTRTQGELSALNDRLEDLVAERTAALTSEIAVRRQAQEQLAHLTRQYELILFSAAEGILGLDRQGNHTFVNPAAARMLGFDAEELLGRPSHSLWHHTRADGSPYPAKDCQIHAAYQDGAVHRLSTEVFWRKDGTSFPVEYASTPMREQDRLAGAVLTFADITERLRNAEERGRLEDQLRQVQKIEAIGSLAGGVAHDFNNLTAIVLGYGEMLLGQLQPEDPARKWAEQIVAAGRRSAALTRQLLAFSRRQVLLPEVLDLNALLRNLEQMLSRLIGEDILLELKLAADLDSVTADPGQLEQVVTNLVINARDAMPRGGRLTVETSGVEFDETTATGFESVLPGKYVLLTVNDTGSGMDKATVARIFEPFFTTKEKGKGTGLGLATVHGIVKQSGGHIRVESDLGKGSAFKIYLPRTAAGPGAEAVVVGGEVPRGSGELILLVDDEAPVRGLCETMLTGLGYRVSAAGSGPEAILAVETKGLVPDLVVTDVVMPGMSGPEMAARLRRDRPGLNVLYTSGYPDDVIARHGVLDPGIPFMQKPFSERTLAAKVREALQAKVVAVRPGRSVLMIDDDELFRELVQIFCERIGYTFVAVDSSSAAITALAGQSFDVLLIDMHIPGTNGELILREIRAAGHAAPAIVLTGDVASVNMNVLRPLGAVSALQKSSIAEPLLQAIEAAATSRL